MLMLIHRRLFSGVFFSVKAGKFRDYNISKREWVLDGESVLYANADMIRQTLDYDFGQEKSFDYSKLTTDEVVKHIARFISNLWQISATCRYRVFLEKLSMLSYVSCL